MFKKFKHFRKANLIILRTQATVRKKEVDKLEAQAKKMPVNQMFTGIFILEKSGRFLKRISKIFDPFLKVLPIGKCHILDLRPVVVDSVHTVAQKRSNIGRLRNTQTDEGKNA